MDHHELQHINTFNLDDSYRLERGLADHEQAAAPLMQSENHQQAGSTTTSAASKHSTQGSSVERPSFEASPKSLAPEDSIYAAQVRRSILLHWWEEVLSVILAVVCTALSIFILGYMDGRSRESWRMPIQPNTLVAFLATLTRAALVFPLAECLGHLKWAAYEKPRPLSIMTSFDIASRGPLGAFKFLWVGRTGYPLASSASLITICLLLFQPFMQQSIDFGTRAAPWPSRLATVSATTAWWDFNYDDRSLVPEINSALYRSLIPKDVLPVNTYCPGAMCDYPEFVSLAVCSECEEHVISENALETLHNCTWTEIGKNATRNPRQQDIRRLIDDRRWHENFAANLTCSEGPLSFTLTIINSASGGPNGPSTELRLRAFDKTEYEDGPVEGWYDDESSYHWDPEDFVKHPNRARPPSIPLRSCENVAPKILDLGQVQPPARLYNKILDSHCLNSTTEIWRYWYGNETTSHFGDINGTLTTCSLKPCVKHFAASRVANASSRAKLISVTSSFRNASKDQFDKTADDDQGPFSGDGPYLNRLWNQNFQYCSNVNSSSDEDTCSFTWSWSSLSQTGMWIKPTLDSEAYRTIFDKYDDVNFTQLYEGVAQQTSLLLTSTSWNLNATNITGIEYGDEIYIRVRWIWIVLPSITVVATITILVLTVFDSSRKAYLFKNKILAAIAFELHGWEKDEYGVDADWTRESMRKLEERSKKMMARLQLPSDEDGRLKLKKE